MIDAKAFGLEIAGMVKAQLAPIASRLDAIERRFDALPAPRDGRDADVGEVRRIVGEELASIKSAIEAIGSAPELPDIDAMVGDAVSAAVAAIPAPLDGKSVSIDDVAPLIVSEVEKRVRELPTPRNGVDGSKGEDGKDGIGLAGALIDRSGQLVVTLTNGETRNLGPVVGKDGEPGKPGRDGFNLEDFDATLLEDGRTVLLSFDRGDMSFKVELGIPAMIYRGVYRDGEYELGDTVTWGGSLWHCDAEKTTEKPGDGSKDWTLAAKRGRDGKNGAVKQAKSAMPVRVGLPAEVK